MDNINFAIIDKDKLEELITKVNKVFALLQAERSDPAKLYTNMEAKVYLNVCSKTLQNYRDNGLLRFTQVGRKIYYTQSELAEFLSVNKKELFKKNIISL